MEKIIFEDLPSTNTPISATNLNAIQTNVEDVFNGEEAMGSIVVDDINCKNLFNKDNIDIAKKLNINSIVPNNTGLKVTYNNVSSACYCAINIGKYSDFYGKTITINSNIVNNSSRSIGLYLWAYDDNNLTNTVSLNEVYNSGTTFTLKNTYTFNDSSLNNKKVGIGLYKRGNDAVTTSDYTEFNNLQLELGSEVTNYTPFINIIKEENGYVKESTTFYADDFKCKNMFDKSNIVAGYLSNAGNIVSNTQYSTSNYINVKGIGNITISGSSGNSENICFYDSSQTFISFISTGTNATLTTSVPSNAYYCRITVKNTNLDLVQLEVGSEATPYTPYKNFENEDIYSTNEMVIGTWVDGKPLYRKVIDIGALPNNTTKYVNHNISNVDIITNYYGVCKSSNNIHFKLPYTSVTTTGSIQVYCTNTQIVVQTDADRSGYSGFTIIEYTKTTD